MHIERKNDSAARQPPESGFSGEVRISGYIRNARPSILVGATVSFAPSARTPWKMNPLGQTVVVLSGSGRVQSDRGEIVEVHVGDVIRWSPDEPHWEGASPDEAMTCFIFQEENGSMVSFGERVSDFEYGGKVAGSDDNL